MSLSDCTGCWELYCVCDDGRNWQRLEASHLEQIRRAIDAALLRKRPEAQASVPCLEPAP